MDFISTTILSGIIYDLLKKGFTITTEAIKSKLKKWTINNVILPSLVEELQHLKLTNEMSEIAIKNKLDSSKNILCMLKDIKPSNSNINQIHSGSGDNIGRDKIINN